MERIYHFSIVTSQLYCNELCNNKRERFTDTKLQQRDCCEELGVRFNVGQLDVDVKLEQTASDFVGIKCVSITVTDWEGNYRTGVAKPLAVKHSTHSVTVYILFTTVVFHFHINCIHVPNGPIGTDTF